MVLREFELIKFKTDSRFNSIAAFIVKFTQDTEVHMVT